MNSTSTKKKVKLGIILSIMIIILILPNSSDYIKSLIDSSEEPENSKDEYKGIIDVSTTATEAFVLRNGNNQVTLRASGLNPSVKLNIDDIKNGRRQILTMTMTNILPIRSKMYLNNEFIDLAEYDIIEKYSIKSTKHSISFELFTEQYNAFEVRFVNQVDPTNFSYMVLGDTQGRNDIFELMVPLINAREPDFVVHCGDLTTMGTVEQFQEFLTVTNKLNMPLFSTPGNHDIKVGSNFYQSIFGPLDYSFMVDGYRFISIDSSTQTLTPEQLSWLENESKVKDIRNILFTHVPPFSSTLPDHLYLDLDAPEQLMEILEKNGFRYCFSGHLHLFNYTERAGVEYITTGGGGAASYAPKELGGFRHFIHMIVDEDHSEFEVVRLNEDILKNEYSSIELNGPKGRIDPDLNDLKTFEYLERTGACQNQYGNWVGNGTYKGVDIRILLELVGGMAENDTLLVKALDGYYQEFAYENVYLNESWLELQGPMVLSYDYNSEEPPEWSDGPRLVTLPQDGGYSLDDCKRTSVQGQGYWQYQSAGARWVRNVVSIAVVSY